jgi:erythritol transport system ATP-binding protein
MSDVILEARGILKRYPGNVALDHVDFKLHRNAVNVLIGENGAGKSTLMRILAGVERADGGVITLDGNVIHLNSPRDAIAHGISIVHQELSVMPNLDIAENVFAGREMVRMSAIVDRPGEDRRTTSALAQLHTRIAVTIPAAQLSLGTRQIVELARTLAHGASVLILDEPTSALSVTETESLFEVVAKLKQSGVSIVYISHRLHELLHLGDYFTVLRSGRVVGEAPRSEVSRQWIVERMSGRADTSDLIERKPVSTVKTLSVSDISLPPSLGNEAAQAPLHGISFDLHRGEILGVYGLLGAGRTELVETIAGFRVATKGSLRTGQLHGLPGSVTHAMNAGIVLVPEDRQRDGLVPELSIRENVVLAATGLFLSRKQETGRVRQLATDLNIAARDLELPVTALSGGNQQKVLLARCLMRSPSVLLMDEPTRGVDVGAKAEIYRILRKLAAEGLSIIFTSSEIEETRILADRVLVLCQGRISAEFQYEELSDESLFAAASPQVTSLASTGNAA